MNDEHDLADWYAQRRRKRVADFKAKRPAKLRHSAALHEDIAQWGSRLFDQTAGNLMLFGPTGVAKTWSSWEVMERALKAGYSGEVLMLSQAEWQEIVGPPADRERLAAMRQADVLALDDLGSFRINDWTRELLLPVIDTRWAHNRPTIITSNLDDLDEKLGERITSRLADGATVVVLEGDDLRAGR
ncbi:ATP-binding protein [Nonomuraea pusilla]|uniref:DNA replication protein DnaC n=1 Tax=Nonomuraea pusilla TaxID=46177 RepID=A0A1H8KF19_9ACTN|nr:ATP-binding protein [Nonomuraea pusilla]SEN91573.1 DNA replication protein DnaC [Nonomuraea pusilla]